MGKWAVGECKSFSAECRSAVLGMVVADDALEGNSIRRNHSEFGGFAKVFVIVFSKSDCSSLNGLN